MSSRTVMVDGRPFILLGSASWWRGNFADEEEGRFVFVQRGKHDWQLVDTDVKEPHDLTTNSLGGALFIAGMIAAGKTPCRRCRP